jgi:bla regulator protein BlaR1
MIVPWLVLPNVPMATVSLPEIAFTATPSLVVAALLSLWGLGTALRLLRLVMEVYGLHRRVQSSTLHSRSSLAPIRCAEGLSSPCIWGIARPVILMPSDATDWPREAWSAALAHEEQHLRQNDGLHRLMAALVRAIFWWNPLVHALCRRLELESELCCDEAATRGTGRRAYGELLLSLATGARFETAAAWASAGGLKERLHRLLSPASAPDARWWAHPKRALAVLGAAALIIGCCVTPSFTPLQKEAMLRLSADPFPEK